MKRSLGARLYGLLMLVWLTATSGGLFFYMHQHNSIELLKESTSKQETLFKDVQRMRDYHAISAHHMEELLTDNNAFSDTLAHHTYIQHYHTSLKNYQDLFENHLASYKEVFHMEPQDIHYIQQCLLRVSTAVQNTSKSIKNFQETLATQDTDLVLSGFSDVAKNQHQVFESLQKLESSLYAVFFSPRTLPQNPLSVSSFSGRLGWFAWMFLTALCVACARMLKHLKQLHTSTEAPYQEYVPLFEKNSSLQEQLQAHMAMLVEKTKEVEKNHTLQRRHEHDLAEMRLYHENLVNNLKSAIVTTNTEGIITSFNTTARQFFALTENEHVSSHPLFLSIAQHIHSSSLRPHDFLTDTAQRKMTGVVYDRHTQPMILDVTVLPYKDETGTPRGLLWVCDDTTETVKTKHQLLHAERLAAVGQLSAQVAHEIRNPLSAIALNAELLEEDFALLLKDPKKTEAVELLHAIANEIYRLSDITEGYLQLARMPSPHMQHTDLHTLLTDVFAMLNEELKSHRITYQFQLHPHPLLCSIDPGQIRQALLNIVRNSREAMPSGGSLTVRTHVQHNTAIVSVCDTGSGVPHDILPRVFEPFYSTKPQGTGLGLSLTQHIMQEHQGFIELLPNKPQGTVANLHFPLSQAIPTAP